MALNGANIDTATEFFPSENRRDRESLEFPLHVPAAPHPSTGTRGSNHRGWRGFTTIAADGAWRISVMKRILPWKYIRTVLLNLLAVF